MNAGGELQKGDTMTSQLRKVGVDVAAFLDTAFQVRFVEVGEGGACVIYGAPQLVRIAGRGGGICCVVDSGAAEGGDLGADWEKGDSGC